MKGQRVQRNPEVGHPVVVGRGQPPAAAAQPKTAPAPAPVAAAGNPDTLLLKDATLEDIVRHLHALNIEPTFRHLIKR